MKSHPAIKILVVVFSLSLASFIVWQMTKNLTGEPTETQQAPEPAAEEEKENPPIIISSKSPLGSVRLKDVEDQLPEFKKEEEPKVEPGPILPSSKSGIFIPPAIQKKAGE